MFQKAYGEDELAEEIPASVMRQIIGVLRKNRKKIKSASTAAAMVPSSSSTSRNASMEQGYPFMHMTFEYLQQQKVQARSGERRCPLHVPREKKTENTKSSARAGRQPARREASSS